MIMIRRIVPIAIPLVLLILVACLIIFLVGGRPHFLTKTLNELFFDVEETITMAERLAERGYRSELDIEVKGEEANRSSDFSLQVDSLGFGSEENVKARVDGKATVNDSEHRASIALGDKKLYFIGYDSQGEQFCIYLPLEGIADQLDGSVLNPDNGSKFAMPREVYDQFRKALEYEVDSETEEELEAYVKRILPEIKEQISLNTTNPKKGTTAITLTEQSLGKLVDIIIDTLGEFESLAEEMSLDVNELDSYKSALKEYVEGYTLELVYTVKNNNLTEAHLSIAHKDGDIVNNLDLDLEIKIGRKTDSARLTFTTMTYADGDQTIETAAIEYVKTKKFGRTEVTLDLISGNDDDAKDDIRFVFIRYGISGKFIFEYYSGEDDLSPQMRTEGKLRANRRGFIFTVSAYEDTDMKLTDLLRLSVKQSHAGKKLEMPEGENFFDLTTERIDEIVASIDFAKMDTSLWQGFGKKIHLSEDGFPIINYSVVLNNKEVIEQCFEQYLRQSYGADVKNIYYYDPNGIYILCSFKSNKYSTRLYYFPGDLLDEYHESHLTGGQFFVHDYDLAENKPADCLTDGYKLWRCSDCGAEYKSDRTFSLSHDNEWHDIEHTYDVGVTSISQYSICSRCGVLRCFSLEKGDNLHIFIEGNVIQPWDFIALKHIIFPEEIYEMFDLSDIVLDSSRHPYVLSIRIPDGRDVINDGDFVSAPYLQVLWLPGSITEIKSGAFHSNNTIHTIFFEGTEDEWNKIKLNGYEEKWADVEVIFVPDGADAETVMSAVINPVYD